MNASLSTALVCAFSYWFVCSVDDFFGLATSRPIVLGSIVGLLLGDLKTGVIMGAALEAIFMGVSPVGGIMASNTRLATCVGVGFVISTGIDIETGLAVCVPIGSLVTVINPIQMTLKALTQPFFDKYAKSGEMGKFRIVRYINTLVLYQGLATIIIFFSMYFGAEVVGVVINQFPPFLTRGLNAAGSMLVVIGLALTTQSLWSKQCGYFVLLGFILAKLVGLDTLPIAILGVVIVALTLYRNLEINDLKTELKNTAVVERAAESAGGDDFYD